MKIPMRIVFLLLNAFLILPDCKAQQLNDSFGHSPAPSVVSSPSMPTSLKQDLNFEFESSGKGWHSSYKYGGIVFDTVEYVSGRSSYRIQSNPRLFFGRDFAVVLSQYIQLPMATNLLEASIFTKSVDLESAWLKVYLLDHNEQLVWKDSVKINDNRNQWGIRRIVASPYQAQKLFLEIEINNMNSYPFGFGKIWLDKMELKINGRNIESLDQPVFEFRQDEIENIRQNISLQPLDLSKISDLNYHRIIALGETVHGSHEMGKMSYNIARYLIENEQCRLILLEIPYSLGLRVNDFVNGNVVFDLDQIFRYFFYDQEELGSFLTWIRNYNSDHQRKVMVLGTDIDYQWLNGNFVRFLSRNIRGPEADTILKLLRNHQNRKARDLIIQIPDERLGLSKTNRKLISEYFRYNEVPGYFIYNSLNNKRDYIQYIHCRFAIDSLLEKDEKAMIYAHIGHLNKKNAIEKFYTPAAGNYLSKYYGNDYFVIGLLTGSGTLTYYESGDLVTVNLDEPAGGSLEDLCLKAGAKIFYKRADDSIRSYSYRMSGNRPFTKPFYPYNFLGRMDAFIFFDQTRSIKIRYPLSFPD